MIIRIMVIDPEPRDVKEDTIIYQVPEGSRAFELLTRLLDDAGIEWVDVKGIPHRRKKSRTKRTPKETKQP